MKAYLGSWSQIVGAIGIASLFWLVAIFLGWILCLGIPPRASGATKETLVRVPYQCEKRIWFEVAPAVPCPITDIRPLHVRIPVPCRYAEELKVGENILRREDAEANEVAKHWRIEVYQK